MSLFIKKLPMMDRKRVLNSLLNLNAPLPDIKSRLSRFEWDSDIELEKLTEDHLSLILNRYVSGELTGTEVEEWANLLECREDVGCESLLAEQVLHELANPDVTEALSYHRAQQWMHELNKT